MQIYYRVKVRLRLYLESGYPGALFGFLWGIKQQKVLTVDLEFINHQAFKGLFVER
jgi:hypothetical protein